MPKVAEKNLYRVIDANFNRAKEGLRVCEDTCRFLYDQRKATERYKKIRHQLTAAVGMLPLDKVIVARDIAGDVGKESSADEFKRSNVDDVFYANSQRAKESLRVLEEFSKLLAARPAESIKRLRYEIYELEKEIVKSFNKRCKGRVKS